jgi:hypothetical protein
MTSVELKGRGSNITWKIVGMSRAPNEGMQLLEKQADWTGYLGRTTKRSIMEVTQLI